MGRGTDGPESGGEHIEVRNGFVNIRGVDIEAGEVAEPHVGSAENRLEVVERERDLVPHVTWVLRVALGVNGGLNSARRIRPQPRRLPGPSPSSAESGPAWPIRSPCRGRSWWGEVPAPRCNSTTRPCRPATAASRPPRSSTTVRATAPRWTVVLRRRASRWCFLSAGLCASAPLA